VGSENSLTRGGKNNEQGDEQGRDAHRLWGIKLSAGERELGVGYLTRAQGVGTEKGEGKIKVQTNGEIRWGKSGIWFFWTVRKPMEGGGKSGKWGPVSYL